MVSWRKEGKDEKPRGPGESAFDPRDYEREERRHTGWSEDQLIAVRTGEFLGAKDTITGQLVIVRGHDRVVSWEGIETGSRGSSPLAKFKDRFVPANEHDFQTALDARTERRNREKSETIKRARAQEDRRAQRLVDWREPYERPEIAYVGPSLTVQRYSEGTQAVVEDWLEKHGLDENDLARAFSFDHPNYHVSKLVIRGNPEVGILALQGEILESQSGEAVGSFSRTIEPQTGVVEHASFFIARAHQGNGMALMLNAGAVEFYDKIGIDEVELLADGGQGEKGVGRYAWAVQGFDAGVPMEFTQIARDFVNWGRRNLKEEDFEEFELQVELCEHMWEFAAIRTPGYDFGPRFGDKAGKAFLILSAESWGGILHLKDPQARQIFDEYTETHLAALKNKLQKAVGEKGMASQDSDAAHREFLDNEDQWLERLRGIIAQHRDKRSDKKPRVSVKKSIRLVVWPFSKREQLERLDKAIIQTPRMPNSNRIDWEAVPVGASIWITVTDPSSPMHGRPILITKRPDGQAAIDPGEARRHGYKVGSWADEAFKKEGGMAHATFQFGKLHEQKKDEERWKEYEEREKEREPYVQQLRQLRGEASSKTREMEKKFLESMGISQLGLTTLEKETVQGSAKRQALDAGMEEGLAETYGKSVARVQDQIAKRFQRDVALRRLKYYQRVMEKLKEPEEEKDVRRGDSEEAATQSIEAAAQLAVAESQPLEIEAPAVPIHATTPQEVEHHVAEDLLKRLAEARKRRKEYAGIREEAKADSIVLRAVDEGEDPIEEIIRSQDQEAARQAVEAFEGLQRSKAEQKEVKKIMPEKLPRPETSGPNAIESLRLRAVEAVDDEKIQEAEKRYRAQVEASPEQGFYSVVSEHWNDEDGYLINGGIQDGASDYLNGLLKKKKGFVSGGAAAALTGIVGKHTGLEMDVGRLSAAVSPEVAATIVGYALVGMARTRQLKDKGIGAIVDEIERDNQDNLLKMEEKALERDRDLKASYAEIKRQRSNGELRAEATIMRLEAENILQRRENIGRALGSLAASGTLLAAMKRAQKDIDERLSINVGSSRDNATRILEALGVKPGRKMPSEIKVTHNFMGDTIQYQITANASDLASRWAKSNPIATQETKELEKIKNDPSPVTAADSPPHFKKTWTNEMGQEEPFLLREGQRNDINFLKKLGGGLITRSTGAGKTFTGLGFASHVLSQDKNARQIVIVPDGLVDQWIDQATRGTNLNMLKIPEKQTKDQRAKVWKQVQDGHVVVVSHSDALKAQADVDAIVGANFRTAIIDEPQNLKSQSSAALGAAARRIINIPFRHRVALTATPARESFDEIYDWCLPYDAQVTFADGRRLPIGYVCEHCIRGNVLSLNTVTGHIEAKPIVDWPINPARGRHLYSICFDNGVELDCTDNHEIWTQRGWVRADHLTLGDTCIFANGDGPRNPVGRCGDVTPEAQPQCDDANRTRHSPARLLPAQVRASRSMVQVSATSQSTGTLSVSFLPNSLLASIYGLVGYLLSQWPKTHNPVLVGAIDYREPGLLVYGRWFPWGRRLCSVLYARVQQIRSAVFEKRPDGSFQYSMQAAGGSAGTMGYFSRRAQRRPVLQAYRALCHSLNALQDTFARVAPLCDMRATIPAVCGYSPEVYLLPGLREGENSPRQSRLLLRQQDEISRVASSITAAVKVASIAVKPCPETVYCLTVADNHTFFANGIAVKNCHWASKKLREDKPFDRRGRPLWESKIGSKAGFGRMYAGAGGGTNAQDEAIQHMIFDKLGPFVSGDRFRSRNYKVHHNEHRVTRTQAQVDKQRRIEGDYDTYRSKIEADVKKKAKGKGGFYVKHRVNHLLQREMNKRHWENLHGGVDNGKSQQVVDNVTRHIAEGKKSHIVFVDSEAQRNSMTSAFKKAGLENLYDISELHKRAKFRAEAEEISQRQNVGMEQAVSQLVAKRKADWAAHKEKGEPSVIFIDRTSQAGHNLQKGDTLSIAGRPDDAASQFQIIGRGDRSPREGDFHVDTYRYSDSPWEDTHWNELRNQLKIVQSITPALAKSPVAVIIKSMAARIIGRRVEEYFGL